MEQDDLTREEQDLSPMWEFLRDEYDYRELQRGEIRTGIVVSKSEEQIVVNIGAKREGIVPQHDLQRLGPEALAKLRVGDEVPVYIVRPESQEGEIIVSINLARTMQDWQRAKELMDRGEIFEAKVVGYNKGGVVVDFGQLQGFVPRSHLMNLNSRTQGATAQERLSKLVGQTIPVKVIEVNRRQRRLIMSERVAWREWRRRQKERLLLELREGDIRRGRVSSLSDFGVFVDLGGADGLIHLSELSWDRNLRPQDVVKVGQEIDVYVLNVDPQRKRIGLSLKRLQADPWTLVEIKYQPGDIVKGTITNIAKFGAFARLEPGVEGLIHLSELSDVPVSNPRDVARPGQECTLRVLDVDGIRRRIALSLRGVPQPEPRAEARPSASEKGPDSARTEEAAPPVK